MTANKSSRLVGIFLLFFALLNFPIIGLFNKKLIIGGIPLLYLYLFLVWLIFIIFMFLIIRKTSKTNHETTNHESTNHK